jgi:AraC family transcriptional regulator
MRRESAIRATMAERTDDVFAWAAPSYANRSLCFARSTSERVGHLIREAMAFLRIDREATMRCLNDASALLGSELQGARSNAPPIRRAYLPGGLSRWQAERALAYIEINLGNKIRPRELADLVALRSKSHFCKAFKRSLGLAPMAYVTSRRVERAKFMMTSTREQLSEIALACGFADQSHLSRLFHRSVGMSPALWRRVVAERVDPSPQSRGSFSSH